MSRFRWFCLTALLSATPALADPSPWIVLGQAHPECTCRFKGADMSLGAQICIATASGLRMAECVMEQNITSWRAGQEGCPEARIGGFSPRLRG